MNLNVFEINYRDCRVVIFLGEFIFFSFWLITHINKALQKIFKLQIFLTVFCTKFTSYPTYNINTTSTFMCKKKPIINLPKDIMNWFIYAEIPLIKIFKLGLERISDDDPVPVRPISTGFNTKIYIYIHIFFIYNKVQIFTIL